MKRAVPAVVVSILASISLTACGGGDSGSGGGGQSGAPGAGGVGTGGQGGTAGDAGLVTGGSGGSADGGGSGAGGIPGSGGSADAATSCGASTDCLDPARPVCDTSTGVCVQCTPTEGDCGHGKYCDATTHTCEAGCADDSGCTGGSGLHCDPATHQCVGCVTDDQCPLGSICSSSACVPGCTQQHGCPNPETCCGTSCVDLTSDPAHCGDCNMQCPGAPHAAATCASSVCGFACNSGFGDCDLDPSNGCEHDIGSGGVCVCAPGATQPCYDGLPGTEGVGACHGGTATCNAQGTGWGTCDGEVIPIIEVCGNNIDDDCNGAVDDVTDKDGDGWTRCDGDCCESTTCASDPKLVNPGALEVAGDHVDNDCDGTVDNVLPTNCSSAVKFAGVTGIDVAKAMDLCQTTTANPPLPQKKWGVISAEQLLANGATPNATALADLQNKQTAVTNAFGTGGVVPKKNTTMAVISSGMARDANDPGWVVPIPGTALTTSITFPGAPPLSTYVNAHGGQLLPGSCAGATCPVGTGANDSVNIRLTIRVPTNAQGFSYDFRFFSAEYYTYQCTVFNDYFLAMLTTGAAGIPADHNISFDALHNAVSVNNGFFQDCGGNGKGCGPCPNGTAALVGTGFDQVSGGATEWLTTDAPVVPGETMTIEFVLFDVSDHIYDTLVLLDNFRWSLDPVTVGTHE